MAPQRKRKSSRKKKHEYLILNSDLDNLSITQFYYYIKERYSRNILALNDARYSREPFIILGKVTRRPPKLHGLRKDLCKKLVPATCLFIKEVLPSGEDVQYGMVFKAKFFGEIANKLLGADLDVGDRIALVSPSRLEKTKEFKRSKLISAVTPVLLDDSQASVIISKKVAGSKRCDTPDSSNEGEQSVSKITSDVAKSLPEPEKETVEPKTMRPILEKSVDSESSWTKKRKTEERQKLPLKSQNSRLDRNQRQKSPPTKSPKVTNYKPASVVSPPAPFHQRVPRLHGGIDELMREDDFYDCALMGSKPNSKHNYVKIKEINGNYTDKRIDMFAIVIDVLQASEDGRKKKTMRLKVFDETCTKYEPFEIFVFFTNEKPPIQEKWVIRLRHVKIETYQGTCSGRVFSAGSVICYPPEEDGMSPYVTARKKPYDYSEEDRLCVEKLREFLVGKSWNIIALMNCFYFDFSTMAPPYVKLENITDQTVLNFKCEILNVRWFLDAKIAVLTVEDGTICPQYSYRIPDNCVMWTDVVTCKEKYTSCLAQVEIIVKNITPTFEPSRVQPNNFVNITYLQLRRNKIPAGFGLMFVADLQRSNIEVLLDKENLASQIDSQASVMSVQQNSTVDTNKTSDTVEDYFNMGLGASPDMIEPQKSCLQQNSLENTENARNENNGVRRKKLLNQEDSQFDFYLSNLAKTSNCSIVVTKIILPASGLPLNEDANAAETGKRIPETGVQSVVEKPQKALHNTAKGKEPAEVEESYGYASVEAQVGTADEIEKEGSASDEERWLKHVTDAPPSNTPDNEIDLENVQISKLSGVDGASVADLHLQVDSNVDYTNDSELKDGANNDAPLESQNLTEFVQSNYKKPNVPDATVSSVIIRSQMSFSASIWDLKPSISEFPLDVISGFCRESCQTFYRYSTLKFNSDSKPICPECKLSGKEVEVKLQFLFELLLILESFHSVVALVYGDHANKLFGCTERQYIEDSNVRSRITSRLEYYMGTANNCSVRYTPPFPVNLIVINANTHEPACSMRFCLVNTVLPRPAGTSSVHSLFSNRS